MDNLQNEFKTEQRIRKIMSDSKRLTRLEMIDVLEGVRNLALISDSLPKEFKVKIKAMYEESDNDCKKEMRWINRFLTQKGVIKEPIFTNVEDYIVSCEDYDYYCALKTPYQYKQDEEARKRKRQEYRKSTDGPSDPDL